MRLQRLGQAVTHWLAAYFLTFAVMALVGSAFALALVTAI
jgi:hypothetical protein